MAKPKKEKMPRPYKVIPGGATIYRASDFSNTLPKVSKQEARREFEYLNEYHGYEKYRVPYDFRSETEKYHSHMVIVVRKGELPDFSKMTAKQTQQWFEDHDTSSYLWGKYKTILKNFFWALRRWKFVRPVPLKKGQVKEIHSLEDIPEEMKQSEALEFWRTHRLSEDLSSRRRKEKRKLVSQSSDLPDWSKMVHKEELKWWNEHEIAEDFWKVAAPRERTFVYTNLGLKDPATTRWERILKKRKQR